MSTNLKIKFVSRIARFAVALMGILVLTNIAIAQQKSNPVSTVNPDKWQGFYGGVSVGYMMGWYQKADGTTDTGVNGALGGVQFGYDWQSGQTVYGVVVDYNASSASRDYAAYTSSHSYVASIHGRAGQLIAPDVLLYGLGGIVFSDTKDVSGGASDVQHGWGYTIGAGIEKFIAERTSLFSEYRYHYLNKVEFDGAFTGNSAICEGNAIRVGINFRI